MLKNMIATFILSACATGALVAPAAANAKWERRHSFHCITPGGQLAPSGGSGVSNTTFATMGFYCPIRDDDRFSKQEITALNVHVFDGNSVAPAVAKACMTYWSSNGGSCSGSASSNSWGIEDATLSPSTSLWTATSAAHFGYVYVELPPTREYTSTLRGYYTRT